MRHQHQPATAVRALPFATPSALDCGKPIDVGTSDSYGASAGVSVATGPTRWFLTFVGGDRVLVRGIDAGGRRRGGASFNGDTVDDDLADVLATELAYSPRTKALFVLWAGEVYDRFSDRGGHISVRARLLDGSTLRPIGPLYKETNGGSGDIATLAPAPSGRDYVLLFDDSAGPGYPQPYTYSLYSQHLTANR